MSPRPRERVLANLESIYREAYERAKAAGDQARMADLDAAYQPEQLLLEVLLDVRDARAGPPQRGCRAPGGLRARRGRGPPGAPGPPRPRPPTRRAPPAGAARPSGRGGGGAGGGGGGPGEAPGGGPGRRNPRGPRRQRV